MGGVGALEVRTLSTEHDRFMNRTLGSNGLWWPGSPECGVRVLRGAPRWAALGVLGSPDAVDGDMTGFESNPRFHRNVVSGLLGMRHDGMGGLGVPGE